MNRILCVCVRGVASRAGLMYWAGTTLYYTPHSETLIHTHSLRDWSRAEEIEFCHKHRVRKNNGCLGVWMDVTGEFVGVGSGVINLHPMGGLHFYLIC